MLQPLFKEIGLRYLDKEGLLRRFIDPAHLRQAQVAFPHAPWKYYLLPHGQYAKQGWQSFLEASAHVVAMAHRASLRAAKPELSPKIILDLYSLLIFGRKGKARGIVWIPFVKYNDRSYKELRHAFGTGRNYRNGDGLKLSCEGFWPLKRNSLDLFFARQKLSQAALRKILYPKVDNHARQWHVYWRVSSQDRLNQLKEILRWYHQEVLLLNNHQAGTVTFKGKVLRLAVKMQRYLDAAHIFPDGSGRMSRLIQDYIFLRFGIDPPKPVLYRFQGKYYENGTYLPLSKALDMAQKGCA